jgi:hypothetical protein
MIDLDLNEDIFARKHKQFMPVKSLHNLNDLLIRVSTALQAKRTKNIFVVRCNTDHSQAFLSVNKSEIHIFAAREYLDVQILVRICLIKIDLLQVNHLAVLIVHFIAFNQSHKLQSLLILIDLSNVVVQMKLKLTDQH